MLQNFGEKNCKMDENMSKLLSETNKESIPMLMKSMRANGWSILESKGMTKSMTILVFHAGSQAPYSPIHNVRQGLDHYIVYVKHFAKQRQASHSFKCPCKLLPFFTFEYQVNSLPDPMPMPSSVDTHANCRLTTLGSCN